MASEFGRLPGEIIYAIGRKVIAWLEQVKNHVLRITSPLGKDIQYEFDPHGLMGSYRTLLNMPGDMLAIPGGCVGLNPTHGFGVLCAEMISPKVEFVDPGMSAQEVGDSLGKLTDRVADRLRLLSPPHCVQFQEERIKELTKDNEDLK